MVSAEGPVPRVLSGVRQEVQVEILQLGRLAILHHVKRFLSGELARGEDNPSR